MRYLFRFTLLLLGLTIGMALALNAQTNRATEQPQFEIAVDTLGIQAIGDSAYMTWVFARESPKHHPVSGILVGFDCRNQKVARFAHVVYKLMPDGQIVGPIEEDPGTWVLVSNPRLFALVCEIGPKHGTVQDTYRQPETPKLQPGREDWRDL